MAKIKELTTEKRIEIRVLYQEGKSFRKIAAQTGIAKSTVQDTISRFKTHGTVNILSRIGSPRKTTVRIDDHIV